MVNLNFLEEISFMTAFDDIRKRVPFEISYKEAISLMYERLTPSRGAIRARERNKRRSNGYMINTYIGVTQACFLAGFHDPWEEVISFSTRAVRINDEYVYHTFDMTTKRYWDSRPRKVINK